MAIPYEPLVAQDLNLGHGTVPVTMPGGGTALGDQINLGTFSGASLSTYADNAAALAGGLEAGDLYRTSTGVLMVVYTP